MYCSDCGNKTTKEFCSNCGSKIGSAPKNNDSEMISSKKLKKDFNKKFKSKFKRVYMEIDAIKLKASEKEGVFFDTHVYTQSELLDSPNHKKIFSITEKIGNDVQNWHINGSLSYEGRSSYSKQRNKVEKKLHKVALEIKNREPTFWEKVSDALNGFVKLVMNNIPELGGWLLEATSKTIARLPTPIGWLASKIAININTSYNKIKYIKHQD